MSVDLLLQVAHVPRICHEDKVAEFQKPLTQAMHQASKRLLETKPDVVVIISCHFTGTFHHYVNCAPVHKGSLTAVECPDLISDVPYHYPGDPETAESLVKAGKEAGLPIIAFKDEAYVWDYGTLVPMRYLIPDENIPVIDLSVCYAASLDETYKWGQVIGETLRKSSKKAAFISSGALSHNLVRGPDKMPTLSEQTLDNKFTEHLMSGDLDKAREMLPQYAKIAGVELGGRHLAMLLGMLDGSRNYRAEYHGYAQSSGSGNPVITFHPVTE